LPYFFKRSCGDAVLDRATIIVEQLLAGERPRLPMADRRAGSKPARPQPPRDGQQSLGL